MKKENHPEHQVSCKMMAVLQLMSASPQIITVQVVSKAHNQ